MNELDVAVREAVARLRVPDHGPDFWDQLAAGLDTLAAPGSSAAGAATRPSARRHAPARAVSAAVPPATPPAAGGPAADPRRVVVGPGAAPASPAPLDAAPAPRPRLAAPTPMPPATPGAPPAPPAALTASAVRPGPRPGPRPAEGQVLEGRFGERARAERTPRTERTSRGTRHVRVERDLAVVPQAMKQQRTNLVAAAVAVVALVVVGYAGNALVRSRSATTGQEQLAAETTSFNSEALLAAGNDPAARAVVAFVGQLAGGDRQGAWDSLGAASQAAVGGREAFDERFVELAEAFGPWATTSADVVLVTPVAASDEGTISAVTLIGTLDGDQRADAFPVRIADGMARLELFADAGPVGLVAPDASQGSELGLDDALAVTVPAEVAPLVRLDQGPVLRCGEADGTELAPDGAGKARCTYRPAGGMEAGGRVLTVTFTDGTGAGVSARSVRFKAA